MVSTLTRYIAALIMLQTLFYKFTAQPESVFIFTEVGMEPWGRYLIGSFELVASVLLLWTEFSYIGAILGFGLMLGALFFHAVVLGVVVQNDGGWLFTLAIVTLLCCAYQLYIQINQVLHVYNRVMPKMLHV